MSVLHYDITLFAEAEQLLFDTDTYVLYKTYNLFKDVPENDNIFLPLIRAVNKYGVMKLPYISQAKVTINPLRTYMTPKPDWSEEIITDLIEKYYCEILYGSSDSTDSIILTNLGKSIQTLYSDEHFKALYIYCSNPTEFMVNLINSAFDDCIIVSGDISDIITDIEFDAYIINDIRYMEYIAHKRYDTLCDVLVPDFKYNMREDGIRIKSEYDTNKLLDQYNINISLINRPFV